jgi:TfoX/Sxy family transcriptional regulator of competence genes
MAYDEKTAARVRRLLADRAVVEQPMMGGLIFMLNGSMCVGVSDRGLLVRVGADNHAAAVAEPHVRPMEFKGGRQPRGFVRVGPQGFATEAALKKWVARAVAFVATLPAKKTKSAKKTKAVAKTTKTAKAGKRKAK